MSCCRRSGRLSRCCQGCRSCSFGDITDLFARFLYLSGRRLSQHSGRPFCSRRTFASLIGYLGQARFPSFFRVTATHPGHASLRSLVDALVAPLKAYVGLAVESPAFRCASSCAADIFGFISYLAGHVYMPERARTSSGEDDPVRLGVWRFRSCRPSHPTHRHRVDRQILSEDTNDRLLQQVWTVPMRNTLPLQGVWLLITNPPINHVRPQSQA